MSRGLAKAAVMALLVISLKVTRRVLPLGISTASTTCQAMASPSRSRSVARYTTSEVRAARVIASSCLRRSSLMTYWGAKSCSTSTPSWPLPGFSGRSRTWPYEASTL